MSQEDRTDPAAFRPGVVVTLDTIYEVLLETKELVAPLPDKVNDHETRLRCLEAWKNRAAGVGATLTIVSGLVGAFVSHIIK